MRKKVVVLSMAIVGMAMAISCSLASVGVLSGGDKAIDNTFGQMIEAIEDQGDTSETTNEEEAMSEYNEDQGDTSETTNEEEATGEYNNWEKELSYKEVEELFAKDRELLEKVKDIFKEYDFNIDIYPSRSRSYSVYYGKSPDRKIFAIEDLDNYEYMLELF
ncbi:MAG: hypothetical protein FWH48_02035, partial [Oscillospiraceae bacterium]|nr:hypothetical protein [Oscillospiraceae bacterium]